MLICQNESFSLDHQDAEPDTDTLSFKKKNKTIENDNEDLELDNYARPPNLLNKLFNSFQRLETPLPY